MKVFFEELKKRRVYRAAIAYAVAASAIVQVAGTALPAFHVRDWVQQVLLLLLALGFPAALVLSWVFEINDGAIRRTPTRGGSGSNRLRLWILAATGLFFAAIVSTGYWAWHPWRDVDSSSAASPTQPIPEKSIAVLPFENLSAEKENAYFIDGVQDEIRNNLSKIADLKVISRTSVQQYRTGVMRNLREIAQQLGVAHVLEGTVQRFGNRVRVNVQLIDARTDSQMWAERYDRDLADVFQIQTEIAQNIVSQLKAQLSPQEKAEMEARPTRDLAAYDLYLQAKDIVNSYLDAEDPGRSLRQAVRLLEEATGRDPNFALAFCYLARAHDLLYFLDLDPTSARRIRAQVAVETALKLDPASAEAHLASADYWFRCFRDYDRAQRELAIARPGLPNSIPFLFLSAYLDRRQGRWVEAENNIARAVELDPRNPNAVNLLADTYVLLRRFADAIRTYDRAIASGLQAPITVVRRAAIEFAASDDTASLRKALASVPPDLDVGGGETPIRIMLALIARDYEAARKALASSPRSEFQEVDFSFYYPRPWYEAIIARAEGNRSGSQDAFARTREILATRLKEKPDDPRTLAVIAQVDAGLEKKEEAIAEATRAVELMPMSRDAYDAPLVLQGLAQVYTWTNETERALDILHSLFTVPGYLTKGYLQVDPAWEPLRSNPGFKNFMESLPHPNT